MNLYRFYQITLVAAVATCLISTTTMAQGVRKYSNEFLSIGIGARALAMGNTQSAIVNDVTAAYWNPAGLQQMPHTQIGLMHAEWFAGIAKYDYAGFAMPIADNKRAIGLSVIRFGVDDIPNTLFLLDPDGSINYDNVTTFSAADYAFLLSYAQKLGRFRVGGNAKIIHRIVGKFASAWGTGLDLGMQYSQGNFSAGLTLKDFPVTYNTWGFNFTQEEKEALALTDNVIPVNSVELTGQRTTLGLAYNIPLGKKAALLTALDMDITTDGKRNTLIKSDFASIDPHFGMELHFNQRVFLRGGINNIQQVKDDDNKNYTVIQPNAGVGFRISDDKAHRIPQINIDYAFTGLNNVGSDNKLYSHIISLSISFDKKTTATAIPQNDETAISKKKKDKQPQTDETNETNEPTEKPIKKKAKNKKQEPQP